MSKRAPQLLLEDIVSSANKIMSYTINLTFEQFLEDEKTVDAVIRNFEIIGEAANRLPEEAKDKYRSIDWHRIEVSGIESSMTIWESTIRSSGLS